MTIISLSWVRNEADIIEEFVRHHIRIVDRMVIINNASTDNTGEILHALADEGLPLDLRQDETTVHAQGEALTAAMHEIAEQYNPDWIIPLDADEFLAATNGNVRGVIDTLPVDTVTDIPWRTYVPTGKDNPAETQILKRIRHRRSIERPQFTKILIPHAFQKAPYGIPLGSHTLVCADRPVDSATTDDLFLAHFPVRSAAQIKRKVVESWERHSANPQKKEGQNFHWQRLYEEMLAGPPSVERLHEIAICYAHAADTAPGTAVEDPIAN